VARNIPTGTPDRSPGYVFPPERNRPLVRVATGAAVFAVAVFALYVAGQRRFTSPGPVSQSHAPFETECAQCHDVGRGVSDPRCERCHDPRGADRFTHRAHVLLGSGSARKASVAPTAACTACHVEHQGRGVPLKSVEDRECGSCHLNPDNGRALTTLARHPEFAAVRAQIETGAGLNFGHLKHLQATVKQFGKRCEACHELTPDRSGFQPMTFDRHCGTCHEHQDNGVIPGDSEEVSPEYLLLDVAGAPAPPTTAGDLGRIVVSGMKHRDPWVVYNAERLRRIIDPAGVNAEMTALRMQSTYLAQYLSGQWLSQLDPRALELWKAALEQEVAAFDRRIAAAQTGSDDAALREIRDAVRQIAQQLRTVEPAIAAALDAETGSDAAPAPSTDNAPQAAQLFAARKAELSALLDAIAARDSKLADRAAALKRRVEQLAPAGSNDSPDRAALTDRLRSLDEIIGAVRATADAQGSLAAADLAALRDVALTRVNGGLPVEEFEDRRRELLAILDAVERTADPAVVARAAVLRQQVLALRPGSYGDAALRDRRARKAKLLDRVKLELALAPVRDPRNSIGPSSMTATADAAVMQPLLDQTRARLAALQRIPPIGAAETPAESRKARGSLANLLVPCLTCHVLDLPPDADGVPAGSRMAPMRPAGTVFQRARFSHKPHVEVAKCESCHATADQSQKAIDINEPGVAKCQECHARSKSRSDCALCHVYHPPSLARLMGGAS
jgi:hypothetical protein